MKTRYLQNKLIREMQASLLRNIFIKQYRCKIGIQTCLNISYLSNSKMIITLFEKYVNHSSFLNWIDCERKIIIFSTCMQNIEVLLQDYDAITLEQFENFKQIFEFSDYGNLRKLIQERQKNYLNAQSGSRYIQINNELQNKAFQYIVTRNTVLKTKFVKNLPKSYKKLSKDQQSLILTALKSFDIYTHNVLRRVIK